MTNVEKLDAVIATWPKGRRDELKALLDELLNWSNDHGELGMIALLMAGEAVKDAVQTADVLAVKGDSDGI